LVGTIGLEREVRRAASDPAGRRVACRAALVRPLVAGRRDCVGQTRPFAFTLREYHFLLKRNRYGFSLSGTIPATP
jgi:hypothetical protein